MNSGMAQLSPNSSESELSLYDEVGQYTKRGRRALPGPPLPPRRRETKESQQGNIRTKNDRQDSAKFYLHGDDSSDDGETHYNIESSTEGYEIMENIQEGYRSLCNPPRGESKKPYDQFSLSGMHTDAASDPTKVQRKERKVGPKKSGKTCLVRRLLRKAIEDVNSTNGVEIHFSKCKAKLGDMKWICQEDDLKFWLETIRCYGTDHSIDEDKPHKDPSVFIVGTHKDKFKGSLQQCKDKLTTEVKNAIENEETRKHVRNYYLVSNTDDTDKDFELLRKQLLVTAQSTTSWNESKPVRWINLEKSLLEEINSGQFILSKAEILEIATNTNQPISDPDEIEAFLVYHHGIGTYTYFKDLPDYVVLFPQWLANAFRCIVFADIFQVEVSIITEWNQFRTTGQLSKNLLDHLFACQSSEIKEHRDHILAVMEKFDIIVRPKIKLASNKIVQESNYFVPCMKRTKDLDEVIVLFKCESKSSWLCLEFEFLPPPLTTSLLLAYSRELAVASVSNSTSDSELVFYSNFALFYLKDAEDEMLLIAAHKNILQMQVWKWGHIKRSYSALRKELDAFLQRLGRLFQMELFYKTKLKCSASTLACCVGMEDIDRIEEKTQYFCKMHSEFHCTNEISDEWIGTTIRPTLTKEQINASRMSIITLTVLTDALYDRLAVDSSPVRSRTECDISYLYAELRRQNRHMPSKGSWGGTLKDIQETDKKIGDDIERIRLIRNEIQHLSAFAIDNSRFRELCRLVRNVAKRMELNNNKSTDYTNGVKDILQQEISHKQLEEQE
ncbi:unnamed protein product [Mytilus coruscus]|uniref:COR domain-containing protein n=1 Tax=Mytilus coruscus TaxID=42192 RepID=A0A6J8EV19_MYTCO|nr:unnamed protein product [Mytilus coruscus]